MARKKTYSLYLAKTEVDDFSDILTDKGRDLLNSGVIKTADTNALGDMARLFVNPGRMGRPSWVRDIEATFELTYKLSSKSPSAVVAFRASKRVFAITFGYGHTYLDIAKLEADFGLRVAVNFISDDQIRSVERTNLGVAIRDFAQAAGKKELSAFRIEDALDLIRKVSGYSKESDFAHVVTGARALRFSKELEFNEVPKSANDALQLFSSDSYKDTPFAIIDSLSPVSDPVVEDELNDSLVRAVKERTDEFEIGYPEFLSNDVSYFKFARARINDFYADLSLELYCDGLGGSLEQLSIEDLKRHQVSVFSESSSEAIHRWPVFATLVGSLAHEDERYALNEGKWYRIDSAFKDRADADFSTACIAEDSNLGTFVKKVTQAQKGKAKEGYEAEKTYNSRIAKSSGYVCLDDDLVPLPGIAGRGIEVCDLLDIANRRFIHVKKSSRSSSVLSHLFKQGTNSAQLFRSSADFRSGILEKLKKIAGGQTASDFEKSINEKWMVEFRIADQPRKDGEHNIPFFSKLSFRDERARIQTMMGMDVGIGFISLPRAKLRSKQ